MAQACSISGGCLPDWPQQSVQIFLTSDRSNNIPVYMLKLGGFLSRTMEIYYHWHRAEKGRQRTVKTFSRSFRAVYFMKDMSLITDLRIIWQFFFISSKPYYRLALSYHKSVQHGLSSNIQESNLSLNKHRNQHRDGLLLYITLKRFSFSLLLFRVHSDGIMWLIDITFSVWLQSRWPVGNFKSISVTHT